MTIHHIALLKYKPDTSSEQIATFLSRMYQLPSLIPTLDTVMTGKKISSPFDRDYDQGIIFTFKDEEALKEYVPHKAHRDIIDYLNTFIEDKMIFDILAED